MLLAVHLEGYALSPLLSFHCSPGSPLLWEKEAQGEVEDGGETSFVQKVNPH